MRFREVGYERARGNVNSKLGFLGSLGSKGYFFLPAVGGGGALGVQSAARRQAAV